MRNFAHNRKSRTSSENLDEKFVFLTKRVVMAHATPSARKRISSQSIKSSRVTTTPVTTLTTTITTRVQQCVDCGIDIELGFLNDDGGRCLCCHYANDEDVERKYQQNQQVVVKQSSTTSDGLTTTDVLIFTATALQIDKCTDCGKPLHIFNGKHHHACYQIW